MIERGETFLTQKARKLASAVQSGMSECTFKPRVLGQRPTSTQSVMVVPTDTEKPVDTTKGIVERLYAYLDYYEKRKEDYKNKLSNGK